MDKTALESKIILGTIEECIKNTRNSFTNLMLKILTPYNDLKAQSVVLHHVKRFRGVKNTFQATFLILSSPD